VKRIALLSLLLLAACGCKDKGLSGPKTQVVWITVDSLHSVVGLPETVPKGKTMHHEWAYAERQWYLENRKGCTGACRAMLWPSEAIVEEARTERPFGERTPDAPVRVWRIPVCPEAVGRIRKAAEREIASGASAENGIAWHGARKSYHLFSHCHHFTARLLRAGGIHVSRGSACTRGGLMRALDAAARPVPG
jgi:hypothetical protein